MWMINNNNFNICIYIYLKYIYIYIYIYIKKYLIFKDGQILFFMVNKFPRLIFALYIYIYIYMYKNKMACGKIGLKSYMLAFWGIGEMAVYKKIGSQYIYIYIDCYLLDPSNRTHVIPLGDFTRSQFVHIYICVCVCVCAHIYIYIYIYTKNRRTRCV